MAKKMFLTKNEMIRFEKQRLNSKQLRVDPCRTVSSSLTALTIKRLETMPAKDKPISISTRIKTSVSVPFMTPAMQSNFQISDFALFQNFFFYVGPPKEDIFSGHLLSPVFQFIITHYIYKLSLMCGMLLRFSCLLSCGSLEISLLHGKLNLHYGKNPFLSVLFHYITAINLITA